MALCVSAFLVLSGCLPQPGAKPRLADSWYIQLTGTVDTTQPARVYDVDGFDTSAATVATLHAEGKLVVCYLDVGSVESYRPDYAASHARCPSRPRTPSGPTRSGSTSCASTSPGRRAGRPRQPLAARLDLCRSKGFDAVDPDMMEVYAATGVTFSPTERTITAADQLTFNRWIAAARPTGHVRRPQGRHRPGEAARGQLRLLGQRAVPPGTRECGLLTPFVAAGKPVLNIEYGAYTDAAFTKQVCSTSATSRDVRRCAGFSSRPRRTARRHPEAQADASRQRLLRQEAGAQRRPRTAEHASGYRRSMMVTLAWPPPSHMVCRP